jgi:release factor glutamine methyltransferase
MPADAETSNRTTQTVRDAVNAAERRFQDAGCDTPRLDADLLLAHVLETDREALYREPERRLDADEQAGFEALVQRREAREPVAYITGRKAFRHIELHIDERVLVPRPETELLVEVGAELPRGARVVDVGTGSGAVALALKHERPDLDITGVDLNPEALELARENADRLGLDVTFRHGDLLEGATEDYDAVLANLPYIDPDELPDLYPELRAEPRTAVVAGEHGLALIRRLVGQLDGTPLVGLEAGGSQAERVREFLRGAGFAHVESRIDLYGIERVTVGRRA